MADLDNRGEEGDEDEELNETVYKSLKDAVLFAIEVSPSMLEGGDHSAVVAALKCGFQLMQQRIISNPNDMMGILLFGTQKSKFQSQDDRGRESLTYPHCYLLADLDIPAAEDVKALKSLIEDKDDFEKLLIPSTDPVSMSNVLFCANQVLTTRAANFTSRRLFVITDNDNPHSNDKTLRSAATVRAKDLYDLGVIIELFPISRPDHEFDQSQFYDDIIYKSSPAEPDSILSMPGLVKISADGNGISLLKSLLSSINSKSVARRALFANLPLEFGPSFRISVKGYILFKRQEPARSCYVWLGGEKAQIATGVSTQTADDTARTVEKGEIRKAYKFGGDQIMFTQEEMAALRYFGDPGIRIIGFKPLSMLPIWANLKPATFIYPSEEDYIGSTRVFSALHQKLLNDRKMGITWFIARKNAAPVIAALIPGPEQLGDRGEQIVPAGMWLAPLPFADDIRQHPDSQLVRAPDVLTDEMRKIIQQLTLPKAQYDPARFPNPALQWHYRILQAMALDEELPEKPEDKTIPKYRQMEKRVASYVAAWKETLEREHRAWHKQSGAVVSKRGPTASGTAKLAKRIKES